MKYMSKAEPSIPVGHPDYKWTPHGDVQAVWRKFGWVPPSENMTPPPPEKPKDFTTHQRSYRA